MNEPSKIIKPHYKIFNLQLKELISYKDLILMYVKRDIITFYKQTILGPLWFVIQPILMTIMFMYIFGNLAGISTDNLPQSLFYYSGIIFWNYFSDCLNRNSKTFLENQNVFGKVYFPRLVIPVSITISNLIRFFIQLLIFIALYLYYLYKGVQIAPNLYLLLFPLLIVITAGLSLAFGTLFSSLTTKYRDLNFLLQFGVQLWMYASPIIYPLSSIPQEKQWILLLNPMTSIIETFKFAAFGSGVFSWFNLLYSFSFMVILLLVGFIVFNRVEKGFMDTV